MGSGAWGMRVVLGVAILFAALPSAASGALFNSAGQCVDTTTPTESIPPPDFGVFEIHVEGDDIPIHVAQNMQIDLVQHAVQQRLHDGLGVYPNGFPPRRIPIYITDGNFDRDGNLGLAADTCADRSVQALLVKVNQNRSERASTAAHELFHAYSAAVQPIGRPHTWWEEAAASWSEPTLGFPQETMWDGDLQKPQLPIDSEAGTHEYAIYRFVQFLGARGLVTGPSNDWNLHRTVIPQYGNPGPTLALSEALSARGTSLADELAAFWGDRIKNRAAYGPRLRATPQRTITIRPGNEVVKPQAVSLGTWFRNFKLADSVRRVEFEFEPRQPTQGQFWGSVTPTTSERFHSGDGIAFCVGGGSANGAAWPERGFPVTFTNGTLDVATLRSEIEVFAQRDAEQCGGGVPGNRACKLLARADVQALFGGGQFPFYSVGERMWRCVFVNSAETKEVDLILNQAPPNTNLRELRRRIRQTLAEGGFTEIPEGDVAGIQHNAVEDTTVTTVLMLVGRELNAINLYHGSVAEARNLAKRIAGAES